jgi:hypothetical protein
MPNRTTDPSTSLTLLADAISLSAYHDPEPLECAARYRDRGLGGLKNGAVP